MEMYCRFDVHIDMLTACILWRFKEQEPAIQASQLELTVSFSILTFNILPSMF